MMKARKGNVTINGKVTINGNVTIGAGHGKASQKDLDEIRELARRIRENPQDNETTERLIARYRYMIRRLISSHFVQESQRDFLTRIAEETVWMVAKDHELDPRGFSRYLRRSIAQRIERAICHEFLLYIPEEMRNKLWKLEQFVWRELGAGCGNAYKAQLDWTDEDRRSRAMEELDVDGKGLDDLLGYFALTGVDPLFTDGGDESDEESGAADKTLDLEDENADVFEKVARREMSRDLRKALSRNCTERERKVLALKYGLGDEQERTFSEIGRIMGFSESNAKRIAKEALEKMKTNAPELHEYLK